MTLIQKSVILFIVLIILVALPSVYTHPWVIGFCITFGSLLVIWQVVMILKDPA